MKKVLSITLAALMMLSVFSIVGYAGYSVIDYISIQGVTAPVAGAKPVYSANTNNAENFRIYDEYAPTGLNIFSGVQWYDVTGGNLTLLGKNDTFQAGHAYSVTVYLINVGSNNMFPQNSGIVDMSINGIPASGGYIEESSSPYSNNYWVSVTFPIVEETIKSIAVTGVTAPAKGAKPAYSSTVASSAGYTVTSAYDEGNIKNGVEWFDVTGNKSVKSTDTFQEGHSYAVTVYLRAKEDYAFQRIFNGTATVNGKSAQAKPADPETLADFLQDYTVIYTFPAIGGSATPVNFPDVPSNAWFYEAVQYCAQKEFITGYKNGKFGPADPLQRQDFVVILARIAGANLSLYTSCSLSDVAMNSYYGPSVAWAVSEHIITGYNNGKFGVGDNITREQVATILYRYLGSPTTGSSAIISSFPDRNNVSEFADSAMIWAVNNAIITGKNGNLAPTATASRAEIATIIMRMDQKGMF